MAITSNLSDSAKRVLAALNERAGAGFDLAKRTELRGTELEAAVKTLLDEGLIGVQGEPYGDGLLNSYFFVCPDAKGRAALYLRTPNAF